MGNTESLARVITTAGIFYTTSQTARNRIGQPFIYLRISQKINHTPKCMGIAGVKYPGLKKNIRKDERACLLDVDFYVADEEQDLCIARSSGDVTKLTFNWSDHPFGEVLLPWEGLAKRTFYLDLDIIGVFYKKNPYSSVSVSSGLTCQTIINPLVVYVPLIAEFYFQGKHIWTVD